jgi:hypothetical protein
MPESNLAIYYQESIATNMSTGWMSWLFLELELIKGDEEVDNLREEYLCLRFILASMAH